MRFERKSADKWQEDTLGACWFKADLHIHIIDDHAGVRMRIPEGHSTDSASPEMFTGHARQFRQTLAKRDGEEAFHLRRREYGF